MISSAAANTWNISGPEFLLLYGVLCGLAAAVALVRWRSLLGSPRPTEEQPRELDVYRVAMLVGGPRRVLSTAVIGLYRTGRLSSDGRRAAIKVVDGGPPLCPGLERSVLEAVRAHPGTSVNALRELGEIPAVTAIASELEHARLLATSERRFRLSRELLAIGGLLLILGCLRVAAGMASGRPVSYLVLAVFGVLTVTVVVAARVPRTTLAGGRAVRRVRSDQPTNRQWMDASMAVALFGAGALWLADPVTASGLGVSRSSTSFYGGGGDGGAGGGYGGGGGCGGGGCGGGCGG